MSDLERSPYVGIPDPRPDLDSLVSTIRALKENVEILTGQRGEANDAALTTNNSTDLQTSIWSAITSAGNVASAVSTLESRVDVVEADVVANATAITAVDAEVDGVSANGLFKVNATASTTSQATLDLQVKAGTAGSFTNAGIQLFANGSTSTATITASKFQVTDGSTTVVPFSISGGIVYVQNLKVQGNLVVDGTINTGQIAANAVTATNSSLTTGIVATTAGVEATIATLTITRTLGTVLAIFFTCDADWYLKAGNAVLKAKRGTTQLWVGNENVSHAKYIYAICAIDSDTAISGSTTYNITLLNSSDDADISQRNIILMELKR